MSVKYGYQWATYVPWSTSNIRMPYMGGGGDDRHIGPFTEEQSDYIVNADLYSRKAVLATGLACLTADFSWRHDGTGGNPGTVPTRVQLTGKTTSSGKWPETPSAPRWDEKGAHTPSVGVVPFLCRPSPCFIEIAQRDFTWHAANYNSPDAARHRYDEARARGWRIRSYAGAAWLTPDADYDNSIATTGVTRKESLRKAIVANLVDINEFLDKPWNTLRLFYGLDPDTASGPYTSVPRDNNSMFMDDYCCVTWPVIEQIKILRDADHTAWSAMLDKKDTPLRRINDSIAGEWRHCIYAQYTGPHIAGPPQSTDQGVGDFAERNRLIYGDVVPAATGTWLTDNSMNNGLTHVANWSLLTAITAIPRWSNANVGEDGGSFNFDAIRWAAFVKWVERGGAAADAAWAKVYGTVGATASQAGSDAGITNFQTWRQGFRYYARWNMFPRNKI
jgi:hypothetical protein